MRMKSYNKNKNNNKGEKRSKLIMRLVMAPIRVVVKAANFYKTMQVSRLSRSFSTTSAKKYSNFYYEEPENEKSTRGRRPRSESELRMQMERSYSVGIGRIGRIDEDVPCSFEDEDCYDHFISEKVDRLMLYRSRSSRDANYTRTRRAFEVSNVPMGMRRSTTNVGFY